MVEDMGAGPSSAWTERAATRSTDREIRNFILMMDSWVLCCRALYSVGVGAQEQVEEKVDNRFFIRSGFLNRITKFSASGFRIFTLTLKRCSQKTFICYMVLILSSK